jgi:monofunctional biosynthetic peptidoglycan transglycosylase
VRSLLYRYKSRKKGAFRPLLALVILATLVVFGGIYWALESEFPDVEVLRDHYPVVRYRGPNEPPQVELKRVRPPGWVPLASISKHAIGAVLVSEDWAFYSHPGYDLAQIREAMQHDLKTGKFARGASTITQQVVRNVFLSKEKSLWRKLKEVLLAIRLDRTLGKRRTLEIYFNIAEWGPGFFGIGQASQVYFEKSPAELTAREGAFLAMLLPSPRRYSQSFRQKKLSAFAHRSIEAILSKMVRAQVLTDWERDQARMQRLSFEQGDLDADGASEESEEFSESSEETSEETGDTESSSL